MGSRCNFIIWRYQGALKRYLRVAENLLSLKPPFIVEAGATGIKGFTMAMPNADYNRGYGGVIHDDDIKSRHTLGSLKNGDVNSVLLAIFEDFFDAAGENRPENFRGFPSTE